MSTGYDEDGSIPSLVCVGPPDGGGVGGGGGGSGGGSTVLPPDGFIPNCFINGREVDGALSAVADTVPVGLSDFSMEMWAIPFGISLNRDIASDEVFSLIGNNSGFHVEGNGPVATGVLIRSYFAWTGANINGARIRMGDGWRYYVINFDRSGLMTLYMDGVVQDTVDISAAVAWNSAAQRIERACRYSAIVATGPVAYHHTTLLSGAQMRDSMRRRGVQLLATTQGAWDWRNLRGHTGWEMNPVIRAADTPPGANGWWNFGDLDIPNRPIPMNWATPIGVTDEVIVPDISGNGIDLVLSTDTVYTLAAGTREGCTFGADPFFR